MKRSRLGLTAFFLVCLVTGLAGPALGCRCTEPSTGVAYKRADAVARVHVLSGATETADHAFATRVQVTKSWKRTLPEEITVITGEDCAYPLAAGKEYILFLSGDGTTYGTYLCRGNRGISEAKPVWEWLDKNTK